MTDAVGISFVRDGSNSGAPAVSEATRFLAEGQFPAGSMGPKIEAAIQFVTRSGKQVLITDVEHLRDALQGNDGTLVVA